MAMVIFLTKHKVLKWWRNINSTSACAPHSLTWNRKAEICRYGDQDMIEYIDVGATYFFNKNMSTYVDYKINLIDESDFTRAVDIRTDNIVATGITYQF